MGYRTIITLTCEYTEDYAPHEICGSDVAYLGVYLDGDLMTTRMLCDGHARGVYGNPIWNTTATLFSLDSQGTKAQR